MMQSWRWTIAGVLDARRANWLAVELALQVDELDFFGVYGALEEAATDASEAVHGVSCEEARRALASPACQLLAVEQLAYALGGGGRGVDDSDVGTHGAADGASEH